MEIRFPVLRKTASARYPAAISNSQASLLSSFFLVGSKTAAWVLRPENFSCLQDFHADFRLLEELG